MKTHHHFKGPEGQEDMPYLLTPGPHTTSQSVKIAMLADYGSRDGEFEGIVADICRHLLAIAGGTGDHACVLMQGPGTFGIEAALGSFAPDRRRKTLVVMNGAGGRRAAQILARLGRPYVAIDKGDDAAPGADELGVMLDSDRTISHVFLVHCETSSGMVNPVKELAAACKMRGKTVLVDAVSSFGALAASLSADGIDVLVTSPDKCLEGVPGFSAVICGHALLEASAGKSHSLALDLEAQWRAFESTGQFRFTPPTHAIVAFQQALREFDAEGGIAARLLRCRKNAAALLKGMRAMGFAPLLPDAQAGPVIQAFHMPRDPRFRFEAFRTSLREQGFAISPGELLAAPSFRIGTIGRIDGTVIAAALAAIAATLANLGVHDLGAQDPAP